MSAQPEIRVLARAHDPTDVALIQLALAVLRQWHGFGERGDLEGGWLQDEALRAGVCHAEVRTTPCGQTCPCGEFAGDGETVECVPIDPAILRRMYP